ncbi:MAG TPA: molybdate ABC transporter substrate-binding protein [Syntrophomonadaceae bacterium]|nr:molybdate ABC transporter substrate-binding protein [Syntrophomonadaceae bacterium]
MGKQVGKKIIVPLMLLVFLFALVGCGNKAPVDPVDNNDNDGKALEYQGESLIVHSGAGLSKAMDEIGQAFEEKYGATVNMNYAGGATLLGQMDINKIGDVFVGGSVNDAKIAMEKDFTDKYDEIVYHIPAIGVPKGNPAEITSLEDMAKPGVRLVLGDAESNAIGKRGAKIFEKNNLLEDINANVVARGVTVNEIVTQIAMKQCDAGLIWEDNGVNAKDIEIVTIPEEQNVIDSVPACLLNFTENKELAQLFVDYLNSEEAKAIFTKHGFKTI